MAAGASDVQRELAVRLPYGRSKRSLGVGSFLGHGDPAFIGPAVVAFARGVVLADLLRRYLVDDGADERGGRFRSSHDSAVAVSGVVRGCGARPNAQISGNSSRDCDGRDAFVGHGAVLAGAPARWARAGVD